MDIEGDPWSLEALKKLGSNVNQTDILDLASIVDNKLGATDDFGKVLESLRKDQDAYPNESGVRGADFIMSTIK